MIVLELTTRIWGSSKSENGQEGSSDTRLLGFIDEMSKDGLLLPQRSINLGSIVGQG